MRSLFQINKICHTHKTHGIARECGSAAPIHKIGLFEIARVGSRDSTACRSSIFQTWQTPSAAWL